MWFIGEIKTGHVIKRAMPIVVEDVQYPSSIFNLWSVDELSKLEIYPYRETNVDRNYYQQGKLTNEMVNGEVVGTYESTPQDITIIKEQLILESRSVVKTLLERDDWMSVREFEGGSPMQDDIQSFRASIRSESNSKEIAINALSSFEEVIAYRSRSVVETRKIKHTSTDNIETFGPETEELHRSIDMVTYYEAIDPLSSEDIGHVSMIFV